MTGGVTTIGILGVGRLGSALATLALNANYRVLASGSGSVARAKASGFRMPADAEIVTTAQLASAADIVILALPYDDVADVPPIALDGALVVDATNEWDEAGPLPVHERSSSERVQNHFASARVVKAFGHMAYRDLTQPTRASGSAQRKAIGVAGSIETDVRLVAGVVSDFGFDPVCLMPLSAGVRLEPGHPAFGASVPAASLRQLLTPVA